MYRARRTAGVAFNLKAEKWYNLSIGQRLPSPLRQKKRRATRKQ